MECGATWAVVLAAGEGSRLRSLTAGPDGQSTPKQFWSLRGGRSLLGDALARAGRLVPAHRTLAIVAADHAAWWQRELSDLPARNVIVQPKNRGTAVGILMPLLSILERDPEARVIVMASDHYVRREAVLAAASRFALDWLKLQKEPVTLLGVTPDAPEADYGWIVPAGGVASGSQLVEGFVEKPSPEVVRELQRRGGVWNTFIFAARARDLVQLYQRRLPAILDAALEAHGVEDLDMLFERLPSADFSREVLQGAERELRVLTVPSCGWTDLGTPARVRECLAELAALEPVASRRPAFDLVRAVQLWQRA
jgi:mannose-1-phosphate guanylyltransferase